MKILIVSDFHANRVALQAVLVAEPDCENVLCLGDLVDYGAAHRMYRFGIRHVPRGRLVPPGKSRLVTIGRLPMMRMRATPNPMSILLRSLEHLLAAFYGSAQETEIYVRYEFVARFQTSERQSPVAALVVGKNLSQPVDLRAKCNLRSN